MELLSAQPDGNRRDVSTLILHIKVPISDSVTDSIDDPRSPERNPDHLHSPNKRADEKAEQIDVDREHNQNAHPVKRRQQMALEPVVRSSLSILVENAGLANCLSIVEGALEDDVAQPLHQRAVWIPFTISEGVMLSVARHPLLRDDGRRKP